MDVRRKEGGEKEESSWAFKVRLDFKMKREGREGILGNGNSLSNEWRQDGGSVGGTVCSWALLQQRGSGVEKGS